MADARLRAEERIHVELLDAPRGWGARGERWAVISAVQQIQQNRDHAYRIRDGRLEGRVPAHDHGGWIPKHADVRASLVPRQSFARISATLTFAETNPDRALILRLNRNFQVDRVTQSAADIDWKRAGALLVIPQPDPAKPISIAYQGEVGQKGHDSMGDQHAYLTASWLPTAARMPMTTDVSVRLAAPWMVWSEGQATAPAQTSDSWTFRNDLPISFPKIMAGDYQKVVSEIHKGRTVAAWHFHGKADAARAKRDVELIKRGLDFFEENLTPFPFDRYEVIDAENYYGIESYSHTLLAPNITTRFSTHELAHTWFGGIAPCRYLQDTWNEGVTQYVDSVLLHQNADRTLERGLRSVTTPVALSEMDLAWSNGNASYMRGAYVMRMLEREIGMDAVWKGLRLLLNDRVGRDTTWSDLRQYFERASGRKLDWFWSQWITNGRFPTVGLVRTEMRGTERWALIEQTGTVSPFRLRLTLDANGDRTEVMMDKRQQWFRAGGGEDELVEIDPFGSALVSIISG